MSIFFSILKTKVFISLTNMNLYTVNISVRSLMAYQVLDSRPVFWNMFKRFVACPVELVLTEKTGKCEELYVMVVK